MPNLNKTNSTKRQRQIADQKAKGTYVPTRKESLYDAMIPAFKAGMTKDEVRNLIYAARCVHSQGTAIGSQELENMLLDLMCDEITTTITEEDTEPWAGHVYCVVCLNCITCNLRPCRDGGPHTPPATSSGV